jgi:hypothetical protein
MQADGSSAAVVVKLDLQLPSMFVIGRQREAYSIRGSMFLRGASTLLPFQCCSSG